MENTNHPTVAIGVPVYNGEKYLFECLDSILKQNFQDWECVVVDNQSTDKSYEIAQQFAAKDKRFTVLKNKDFVPLVDNWNNAFLNANLNAKYYKLLQADDWMFPNFLEETVRLFDEDKSIGVISSYRLAGTIVDGCGLDVNQGRVFDGKEMLYKQLTRKIDISGDISTLIFSFDHLKRLDFYPRIFNGKYHIDTELFYDILDISNVGFVYQVLSYTRRHPDSQTTQVVFRYNTFLQLDEAVLFRFKKDDKVLNKLYRKVRISYAYFYMKEKFKGSKAYEWHKKHIDRWFSTEEYLQGILTFNIITTLLYKIINKFGRLFRSIVK
jgi:glycosyltransferase involved in cell wall biosynthesis